MTIPGFGNIVPSQGFLLSICGWMLTRGGSEILSDEAERIEEMRIGRYRLVEMTGEDFGFDVECWRAWLMDQPDYGYGHPYAFDSTDHAVRAALDDPDLPRLGVLAAEGYEVWAEGYHADREKERQEYLAEEAARDAQISNARCPFCGQPCPTYRLTCKYCGEEVGRGESRLKQ